MVEVQVNLVALAVSSKRNPSSSISSSSSIVYARISLTSLARLSIGDHLIELFLNVDVNQN